MKKAVKGFLENKAKTMPILSFPSAQLTGVSVNEIVTSSASQKEGMKKIVERCPVAVSLSMMDLSVEAEAFGAKIAFSKGEIPTVTEGVISDICDAEGIEVPSIDAGRCPVYTEAVRLAKAEIESTPVFCGVIGPYSLAGRLFDMTELMMECFESPDEVKVLLDKATEFIIKYIKAFKEAGADGVVMAEPAAGLLSPDLNDEFSIPFVKRIIDEVEDESFVFCYHNCGDNVVKMAESIGGLGADIYHFGNAIDMADIIPLMPKDCIVMGNVNPVLFRSGTKEEIENAVQALFDKCGKFDNFMISSGCDIPYDASWENIDTYFEKVKMLYV
ncbi:MAG: uroporphyrinogen decarboxylase family protein [Clostridia bacterium]|nr:uroporphyrinogen decarboxylase family protein [Clostridia bacterium]